MRKIILTAAMLAITGFAFAETAVTQLGTALGSESVAASVQTPSAPAPVAIPGSEDGNKVNCSHHHAYPGCPMYCQLNPLSPACHHKPAYCNTNPNGYGCNKSAEGDADVTVDEVSSADDGAKGRCSDHNNNLPGCPGFCARHQTDAACALPFHCRNNMTLYACKKHCDMYPQSMGCAKAADEKSADPELFDPAQAEAAAVDNVEVEAALTDGAADKNPCHEHHNNMPGCPGFCNMHPTHYGCRPPLYCQTNPTGYNCPKKSDDVKAAVTADDEEDAKSSCHDHHNNMPGCPGFCNTHPMHYTCRPPAYCHTNPNGYGCPKTFELE